jgi:3-oxoacyl-[acyl-carrier protein] reductase
MAAMIAGRGGAGNRPVKIAPPDVKTGARCSAQLAAMPSSALERRQWRRSMLTTSLTGRSVLVTGGSKGIGKGIARVFARAGAKVLIVARHLDAAEAAAREIAAGGGTVAAAAADVTDLASMQKAAETAATRQGGLDVLCANAGIFPSAKLEDMTPEAWDEVLGTNLKGTFISVKACLPALKKSDQGRVVVTSSITGPVTGYPGWAHYGATKAGQLGFIRTACIELAKYGITVNAVSPGNIVTEGLQGLGADYLKTMAASIPLKRLGDVEDIGNAALFLASKEAAYITGQTIIVDGGQIAPESLEALAQA